MSNTNLRSLPSNSLKKVNPYFKRYSRGSVKIVDTIVLHWTGSENLTASVGTLKNKKYGYHFLIDNEATVYQGAELNKRVSHAGESYGPNGRNVNFYSYGISLVGTDTTEFSEGLLSSLISLIIDIKLINNNIKYITGHHQVSPKRKIDPYTVNIDNLVEEINNKLLSGDSLNNIPSLNPTNLLTSWKQGDNGKDGLYNDLTTDSGGRFYKNSKGEKYYYNESDVVVANNPDVINELTSVSLSDLNNE